MANRLASVLSASLIVCIAFTGLTEANYLTSCDRATFDYIHSICIPNFNQSMANSNYQHECPWSTNKDSYITLIQCVERQVNFSRCVEPALKDEIFLDVHEAYFSKCSHMEDPGLAVLLLLALPCIITTLLLPFLCVHITTCETEAGL